MLTESERRLVSMVEAHELVRLTCDLVRAESVNPPGHEDQPARVLERYFQAVGLRSIRREVEPGRPNVVVELGGDPGPTVWLNAHLDTVPVGRREDWTVDPLAATVRDGRVIGRGASDNKGGVAMHAVALATLARAGVPLAGRVVLTAVMGEERGNVGTRALLSEGFQADAAVVAEWSSSQRIGVGYRGYLWLDIIVLGRGAHGSRPEQGVNAIDVLTSRVIPAVRHLDLAAEPSPLFGGRGASIAFTMVSGGTAPNVVPDQARATLDIRLIPGLNPLAVQEAARRVAEESVASTGAEVRVEVLGSAAPYVTDSNAPFIRTLGQCIRTMTGTEPTFFGKPSSSDANVIAEHLSIPIAVFGPGNPSGHQPDEYVEISELEACTKILVLALARSLRDQPTGGGRP